MPKPGTPFSREPENDRPSVLPDLLAGLMNHASDRWGAEPCALTPEVMGPEETMPPATPVNAAMPEFLASLRTLLTSTETVESMGGEFPAEAAQDFAHGTNELLNYLLHDVVDHSGNVEEEGQWTHPPEAVQDLPDDTNELLSYMLREVVGLAVPVDERSPAYAPAAALDFADATGELLNYLLSTVVEPVVAEEHHSHEAMADFAVGTQDLLSELLAMAEAEERLAAAMRYCQSTEPSAAVVEESPIEHESKKETPTFEDLTRGLLDGLLASEPVAEPKRTEHGLGEVPQQYIDESDEDTSERVAGPFELLLDAIDSELGPPPVTQEAELAARPVAEGERFVAFDLAGECYALPFHSVLETDRMPRFTYVPGVPAHVRGVMNLRGEIIPIVDLRLLFGVEEGKAEGRVIVMRDRLANAPLALIVDRLVGLASFKPEEITRSRAGLLQGTTHMAARKVSLLDADRVAAAAEGDEPIRQEFNSRNESYV